MLFEEVMVRGWVIYMFCHFLTLRWLRWLKSFLLINKGMLVLYTDSSHYIYIYIYIYICGLVQDCRISSALAVEILRSCTKPSSDRYLLLMTWLYHQPICKEPGLQHPWYQPRSAGLFQLKDRAHLSTFKIFIFEKFSCFIVLVVFLVIVQSSELISVWFWEKNDIFS